MLWLWDVIYIDCLFPWLDAVVVGCYLYTLLISLVLFLLVSVMAIVFTCVCVDAEVFRD